MNFCDDYGIINSQANGGVYQSLNLFLVLLLQILIAEQTEFIGKLNGGCVMNQSTNFSVLDSFGHPSGLADTSSRVLLWILTFLLCLFILFASSPAHAVLVEFEAFNYPTEYEDSAFELYAEVLAVDQDTVRIELYNDSLMPSSIQAIYFEEGVLAEIVEIELGLGTDFQVQDTISNLPASHKLDPIFDTAFAVTSCPPDSHSGIEPDQYIAIVFDLVDDATFEDLIGLIDSGDLRIGLRIRTNPSIVVVPDVVEEASDYSSFSAVNVIPEPSTLALLGLGSLVFIRKNK